MVPTCQKLTSCTQKHGGRQHIFFLVSMVFVKSNILYELFQTISYFRFILLRENVALNQQLCSTISRRFTRWQNQTRNRRSTFSLRAPGLHGLHAVCHSGLLTHTTTRWKDLVADTVNAITYIHIHTVKIPLTSLAASLNYNMTGADCQVTQLIHMNSCTSNCTFDSFIAGKIAKWRLENPPTRRHSSLEPRL